MKQTVAVLYGGKSVEHEVSIITGHQVMDALDVAGYDVLPIYVTKEGSWYAGNDVRGLARFQEQTFHPSAHKKLRRVCLAADPAVRHLVDIKPKGLRWREEHLWADVFFPTIHGSFGEDGSLQGLFECADVPYVGSNVLASSAGMDKTVAKRIFRDAGLPVLDGIEVKREMWRSHREEEQRRIEAAFAYPAIVKPVALGSSIGVSRCANQPELTEALDLALELDDRALVERAILNLAEINCSVIGPPEQASVCEQPLNKSAILSFEDKYQAPGAKSKLGAKTSSGGMASASRIIPAPIPENLTEEIKRMAVRAFASIGAAGVARVDFLLDTGDKSVFVNEINTMPGSLAFYLWEATGVPFDDLVSRLVDAAIARHRTRRETQFSFPTNLLAGRR